MVVVQTTGKPAGNGDAAINTTSAYCRDLVRAQDRDRFTLSLTSPVEKRPALWALFAFNHEIAKTREVVTEPTLGLIRLQWWRDIIAGIYNGAVPAHEVLTALAPVIKTHHLPQVFFEQLIDAREFDLAGKPAASLDELASYACQTTAPLNRLALQIRGQAADDAAIDNISTAYALTGLLRAAPFHADQNRTILPHGFSAREIAARARSALASAGRTRGYLKANAALTKIYLRRMEKQSYDLRDPRLNVMPPAFALAAILGRFR